MQVISHTTPLHSFTEYQSAQSRSQQFPASKKIQRELVPPPTPNGFAHCNANLFCTHTNDLIIIIYGEIKNEREGERERERGRN